ncbi:MAG: hypothetical protein OXM03_11775 [Chloroflexota bacterium]|nr:hypothetical protein [Chloroflexota bacterium]MDE2841296.1 hypothetical protein [Chloroflexota bacterium]MDE2931180.1 hypothetical protein [Chloroflexota bacterium]
MPVKASQYFPAVNDAARSGRATIKAAALHLQGGRHPSGKSGRDHAALACKGLTGKGKKETLDKPWRSNTGDRRLNV